MLTTCPMPRLRMPENLTMMPVLHPYVRSLTGPMARA